MALSARLSAGGRAASLWLFVIGSILFPAALYGLALHLPRWLGAVAPIGGSAFILAGWRWPSALWRVAIEEMTMDGLDTAPAREPSAAETIAAAAVRLAGERGWRGLSLADIALEAESAG